MDNIKTGLLIRELRKEKAMTQKELADLLNITDRAVSKWERGLCAPDIALLEPLAKIFDVTISELIAGERINPEKPVRQNEKSIIEVINYSERELEQKTSAFKRKSIIAIIICLSMLILIFFFSLWKIGYFDIIVKSESPDKSATVTVYDKNIYSDNFPPEDATAILVKRQDGGDLRISYGNSTFQGLWWAPDSTKYVLSLKNNDGETYLVLAWLERNSKSNLNAYLSMGVSMNELANYGFQINEAWPQIEYQFLQWSYDSSSILIYYSFSDVNNKLHEGYFWYNCDNGQVSSLFELDTKE